MMLLVDWLKKYVVLQSDLSPKTVMAYGYAVSKLSRWFADRGMDDPRLDPRRPMLSIDQGSLSLETEQMTVQLVSEWLAHLTNKEKLKPRSVNSYRSSINAVWTGAMRDGCSPVFDTRLVPSRRVPKKIPMAWTLEELSRLLDAAREKKGRRRNKWNTLRRDFWLGLYLFLYDSGSRFGAALDLSPDDVDLRRRLVLLSAENCKTKEDHLVSISEETAEVLARLMADGHERVWPNGVNRQQLYDEHKRTLRNLGLPFDRYHMFHCFRKTTATQLAIASSAEDASRALNHASVALTKGTYIDARQLPVIRASAILPRPGTDPDDDGDRQVIRFTRTG